MRRTQVAHTSYQVPLVRAVLLVSTLLLLTTAARAQEGHKVDVEIMPSPTSDTRYSISCTASSDAMTIG